MSFTGEQKFIRLILIELLLFVLLFTWQVIDIVSLRHETAAASAAAAVTAAELAEAQQLSSLGNFELGQYYFNHDDDPAGPYDLETARTYFNAALRENPRGNQLTWYQLGRIDFIEGKFDTALYKFDKQIEYFGNQVPNVYYMIGLTYGYKARRSGEAEDWQKAEDNFEKYISFAPAAWAPRVDLSWIYFAQGKYDDMIPHLEAALQYHPQNAWLLNMYGLALLNTGDEGGARAQFAQAEEQVHKLTPQIWGESYPGNDPDDWAQGLAEFTAAIEKNLALVSKE